MVQAISQGKERSSDFRPNVSLYLRRKFRVKGEKEFMVDG